jgi:hypothetical protein
MLELVAKRDEVSKHLLSSLTQEPIEPYLMGHSWYSH